MKLCSDCGRHHRGDQCLPTNGARSRSAFLSSLLGLGALGAGCSGAQEPDVSEDPAAVEAVSVEQGDGVAVDESPEAPPTEVDPDEILAGPGTPLIPEDLIVVPAYGIAPMPDPPPLEDEITEGSGESEGSGEGEDSGGDVVPAPEEPPAPIPQPLYGVPSWEEDVSDPVDTEN